MFLSGSQMEHQRLCEVKTVEEENNRCGMFATEFAEAGVEICCESPLVAYPAALDQAAVNKHCELCLSGIESPEDYVYRINQSSDTYSSFLNRVTQLVPPEASQVVWCESGCGAVYCSPNCRKVAWTDFHRQLCPGTDVKKVNKLEELRNLWRGLQVQVPFKLFDIGMILRIVGSQSYTEFLKMAKLIEQGQTSVPPLADAETIEFVRQVFGPAYLVVVGLIKEYCNMLGMDVTSEPIGPESIIDIIHVLLMAAVEVEGSSFKSLMKRYECETTLDRRALQTRVDISSFYMTTEELESEVETAKEFNFAGFGLFKSLIYIRRNDDMHNAEVYYAENKSLLYLRAVKDINEGDEIIIGQVPQQIVKEWKSSMELEEDSSSSDETVVVDMDVDMDNTGNNSQQGNLVRGRRRPFPVRSRTLATSQDSSSSEMESGTEVEEYDEPPPRRRRIENERVRYNYPAASLKTFDGMSVALRDVLDHEFDTKTGYGPECDDFVEFVARKMGIDNDRGLKTMVGRVMKAFNFKNIKKTVYGENGRSLGVKHHYSGIVSKPGVEIKWTYLGHGRTPL